MSIFRRTQNDKEDALSTKKKEIRLDRQRIANAKADAKVEEQRSKTEARRSKTRVRENAGGATVQIKFTEPLPQKKTRSKGKRK